MSDKRKFIAKNKPLPVSQDMEALKAKGIILSQQYSGDVWTDYNEHDPGVTVIENLCYGITEMSYKANLDFEQLFFANGNTDVKISLEDYFLLKQEEVQYHNPVTPLDYRKLFLDNFDEEVVKNIWVDGNAGFNGKYKIYIHSSQDSVKEKILELYNQYRNFGEKCDEVVVLEPYAVQNHISINDAVLEQQAEEVAIDSIVLFFHDIKNYIEPTLRFAKSIKNLKLNEEEINQLQQGPLPIKKFIHPDDLISTSLEKMQEGVDIAAFIDQNAAKWNNLIFIESQEKREILKIARLNVQELEIAIFDESSFLSEFEEPLRSKIYEAYQIKSIRPLLNGKVEWDSYSPKSHYLKEELEDYYSIQYTFPQNYNLGLDDLSMLDIAQQKQIKNLQSYLALFESLLVDFLVKLMSFPELLKVNGGERSEIETQFWEVLKKIPGNLVKDEKGLKQIYNSYSFNKTKQIQVREYALARYGETFNTSLLKRAWGEPENFEERWLACLKLLILEYKNYCQARQNSYNISDPQSDFPLSKKISILLNKKYDPNEPNIYVIEENLLESSEASLFRIVVVVDLKEEETCSEKRKKAIKRLIKEELPFYLNIVKYIFLKNLGKDESISLESLFDQDKDIDSLFRESFLLAYKNWRGKLAFN